MKRPSRLSLFSISLPIIFLTNLSVGMTNPDVINLQKILNTSPETRVSIIGVGSPGHESSYFGNLTKQAVTKFQNKYAQEVLAPAGLVTGNGYVGPLTRKKLNELAQNSQKPEKTAINNDILSGYKVSNRNKVDVFATDNDLKSAGNNALSSFKSNVTKYAGASILPFFTDITDLRIFTLSQYMAPVGTKITMTGNGFDASGGNDLYFLKETGEEYVIKGVTTGNTGSLSFVLPPFPAGRYDMAFKNKNGISTSQFIIINTADSPDVTVLEVHSNSSAINYGSTITLSGSGFTADRNEIRTNVGIFKNISSKDGKKLTFSFNPESLKDAAMSGRRYNKTMKITLYVVNDNGYNTQPLFFDVSM